MALFSKPTARALAIIDLLMANPQQTFGLSDMTRRLKLNKATCHAILSTMKSHGFLHQDCKTKAYRLGPSMAAAGHAAFSQYPSLSFAREELELLSKELSMDCSAIARSSSNLVTLVHAQHRLPLSPPAQTGLRLPNIAPLGACFIAWSASNQLQQWIEQAHESQGCYEETLDQQIRITVISIHKRGYEVTLKTDTESTWSQSLDSINKSSQQAIKQYNLDFQQALCQEQYHLDKIDPDINYDIGTISVPVFGCGHEPELVFTANANDTLSGMDIDSIAGQLKRASQRVSLATQEFLQALPG
ncbi:helix-turn-helix domain-containing protein [Oceanicoccus sagamiensis]|uniref:IclR family transcriptional regulator n=1 Tax=Oceanicoccus sagamiensis TaxID=716816 RepID=A0A1X9NGZ1_9GAMM|nr:helix-turn-helix domain-containing protein [Oceanicoccus sagamiensis]ARN75662.1 hypothetical protein BST96_17035 [Oceanicoccus sagamiensis]